MRLLGLSIFICSLACAQNATLSGRISDSSTAVVPRATVTITAEETGVKRNTVANEEGLYSAPSLAPGRYTVTVQAGGFQTASRTGLVLEVAANARLDFELHVGSVEQAVNVQGDAAMINTESATVGTVVDRQFVGNLPLNGRSFQSLLTLTPGVVTVVAGGVGNTSGFSQFSVNGQRASSNAFIVDGVSANVGANPGATNSAFTSGDVPGLTALGTTQSIVSVDALEEFRVQTSSYAAEYGRQPGGQISMVTRSGTNAFHGTASDYFRNDALDANDWFANRAGQPKPPERQNDFGGTLGGPVLIPKIYQGKNKTFFFVSYEGLRLRLPQFNLTNVPTLAIRQTAQVGVQPILNAFPLPNGRDLGNGLAEYSASYSDPSTLNATSVRVDHSINQKWTIFGRFNYAPSESRVRRAGLNLSTVNIAAATAKTMTLGLTSALRPSMTNELRFNYSDNAARAELTGDNFGGATPITLSYFVPSQYSGPGSAGAATLNFAGFTSSSAPVLNVNNANSLTQHQVNIVDNLSYSRGSHMFKFGFDYRRLTPVQAVNSYVFGTTYTSLANLLKDTNTTKVNASVPSEPVTVNFSGYGQDTWKISRRITFTYGVRWELNPAPKNANGNAPLVPNSIDNLATMQLAPQGVTLWQTTRTNFAPRVGLAYQLRQAPGRETVLRGGFGVFYDTGNDAGSYPFQGFPFLSNRSLTNVAFPLNPAVVVPGVIPVPVVAPYAAIVLSDPNLKLPYTLQWNVALEQALGRSQTLTVSYVGAAGRRLLQANQLNLAAINPSFTTVTLLTNRATSDYDALQAQFQRRLTLGLQALVSYTWSHAIDEDSASNSLRLAQRGDSSFDVRHNFATALSYDIPSPGSNPLVRAILGHWSADTTVHVHSGLPVDLVANTIVDPATGANIAVRPNVNLGAALYIDDPAVPGGRRINSALVTAPAAGKSGNLGRNVLRGLPASQVDFAFRRQIRLYEALAMQLRAEAFNVFNHPNFGAIQTNLTAANFGQATGMLNTQLAGISTIYQIGGPRSLQLSLKFIF